MSNNNVKDWGEFQKLGDLPQLENLVFVGELHQIFIDSKQASMHT